MKERIRQILREETSGLGPKMLNAAYKMMNNLTKDCLWYYDTPEQRFEYSSKAIWLINPETKEWLLELEKSGKLWYYNEIYFTFKRYFNMEESDFKLFIKLWVEDALKRGVSTTMLGEKKYVLRVEDALKRGVSTTVGPAQGTHRRVEDALERGVSTISRVPAANPARVEDALKKGKELR